MASNQNIHTLITALHALGDLQTGYGPKHPFSPDSAFASEIDSFLEKYPFLKQDTAYVTFLESYAGLLLVRDSDGMSLGIYGFDEEVSLHLIHGEGDLIDEAGFLTFADVSLPRQAGDKSSFNIVGIGFGFDTTRQRQWGVYRCVDGLLMNGMRRILPNGYSNIYSIMGACCSAMQLGG